AREAVRDSAAIFCVRFDGKGIAGVDSFDFAHLDHRPRPEVAAAELGAAGGIAIATTYHYGPTDLAGGKLWAGRAGGTNGPGFPVTLPSPASTPPVVITGPTSGLAIVGCEDGRVRLVDQTGAITTTSAVVAPGGVTGRLAVIPVFGSADKIALGTASGEVVVL